MILLDINVLKLVYKHFLQCIMLLMSSIKNITVIYTFILIFTVKSVPVNFELRNSLKKSNNDFFRNNFFNKTSKVDESSESDISQSEDPISNEFIRKNTGKDYLSSNKPHNNEFEYEKPNISKLLRNIFTTYSKDIHKNNVYKSLYNIVTKKIEINHNNNHILGDSVDKTIFLRVFYNKLYESKANGVKNKFFTRHYTFLTQMKIPYYYDFDDNMDYEALIDYFSNFLMLKSKLFSIKVLLKYFNYKNNSIKPDFNKIYHIIKYKYFKSLTDPLNFIQLNFFEEFTTENTLAQSMFNLYSKYAISNETAYLPFLELIRRNVSVLDGEIINKNINPKNDLDRIKNITYDHIIKVITTLKSPIQNNNGSFNSNKSFVRAIFLLKEFFKNMKIKQKIYERFKKNKLKYNLKSILKLDKNGVITNGAYKFEWLPKIYEYITDANFINQLDFFTEYILSNSKNINVNEAVNNFTTIALKIATAILDANTAKGSIDEVKHENFLLPLEISKRLLKNQLIKHYNNDERAYHYITLMYEIIFKTLKIYKSLTHINLLDDENIDSIFEHLNLPENMLLFLFKPSSFENSFKSAAKDEDTMFNIAK